MNRLAGLILAGIPLLVASIAAINFFILPEPPATKPAQKIVLENSSTFQSELQRLKAEIDQKKATPIRNNGISVAGLPEKTAQIDASTASMSVSETEIADNAPDSTSSPLEAERENTEKQNPAITQISNRFLQEKTDEYWSGKTSDLITSVIDSANQHSDALKSAINNVECHSTVCRAEVVHEDQQSAEEFAMTFPLQVSEALPRITYQLDQRNDGTVGVVMYLSTNTP